MRINNHIVIVPRTSDHERLRHLEERHNLRLKGEAPREVLDEYNSLLRMRSREDYAVRLLLAGMLTFPCGDIAGAVSQELAAEVVKTEVSFGRELWQKACPDLSHLPLAIRFSEDGEVVIEFDTLNEPAISLVQAIAARWPLWDLYLMYRGDDGSKRRVGLAGRSLVRRCQRAISFCQSLGLVHGGIGSLIPALSLDWPR